MNDEAESFSGFGFVKSLLLPALLIFLVPVIGLLFFRHAEGTFNDRARRTIINEIRADNSLSAEQRQEAIEFYTQVPFSKLIQNEEFARTVNKETRFYYATFRWAIRLSAWSIVSGIVVVLLAGVCVLLSLRSQTAQYFSLVTSWHVLRIYAALQTIVQGLLLVALSFWVTALWLESYSIKLIVIVALLAVVAVALVIKAIFQKPVLDFAVEGEVIPRTTPMPLWEDLQTICGKVGTAPPDQVIAGIDTNFFVTEHPVQVGEQTYHGRTLFVSLPLLKQLGGDEADAVLAHEMAHFSGNDTLYSRRISPLLTRYGHYLEALQSGGITLPIYYFMLGFRALYQLSLGRLSRQREFRADQIAAETTSPEAVSGALLRIAAYSSYRGKVEQELFQQELALESADISRRIEQGFPAYATGFLSDTDIASLETAHPFDSHPPLADRLHHCGLAAASPEVSDRLTIPGDGRWYDSIAGAEQMERAQWQEFEEQFQKYHAESLPWRFLPETDAERDAVIAAFPEVTYRGNAETLVLEYDGLFYSEWPDKVLFRELTGIEVNDSNVLVVAFERTDAAGQMQQSKVKMKLKPFLGCRDRMLEALSQYYGRHQSAVEYQRIKREQQEAGESSAEPV